VSHPANPHRGEAALELGQETYLLRPTFAALVAAEEEVGPLFALVERAASGSLRLSELAALFWHCLAGRPVTLTRESFSEELAAAGIVALTPALKVLVRQILQGR